MRESRRGKGATEVKCKVEGFHNVNIANIQTQPTLPWRSSMSALKCLTRNGHELMRNTRSIITTTRLYLHPHNHNHTHAHTYCTV